MSHFKLYLSLESTPLPSDRETKKKTTLESTMITSSPSRLISFYSEFIVVSTFEILLKYVLVFSFLKNSAIFQTHIMLQLKFKKLKCSLTYSLTSFSSVNFGFMLIALCVFIHIRSIHEEQHEWYFETINQIVLLSFLKFFTGCSLHLT